MGMCVRNPTPRWNVITGRVCCVDVLTTITFITMGVRRTARRIAGRMVRRVRWPMGVVHVWRVGVSIRAIQDIICTMMYAKRTVRQTAGRMGMRVHILMAQPHVLTAHVR